MNKHAWDLFRLMTNISPMKGSSSAIKTVVEGEPYPRFHFTCDESPDFVSVTLHYDISAHNSMYVSGIDDWEEAIKIWSVLYKLIKKLKKYD